MQRALPWPPLFEREEGARCIDDSRDSLLMNVCDCMLPDFRFNHLNR